MRTPQPSTGNRAAATGPARLALAALVLAAFATLAATQVAGLRSEDSVSTPRFLEHSLGAPASEAPLSRRPVRDVEVTIDGAGYTVARAGRSVSLHSADAGNASWRRFLHGAARPTPFGEETITLGRSRTEEFLTVRRHQGLRTWQWSLGAPRLRPRLAKDGSVLLSAGLRILPVEILDASGREITPAGLRWKLLRSGGGWSLALHLDDSRLPLPYVIDPASDYPSPLYLSSGAPVLSNSWKLTSTAPSPADSTTMTQSAKTNVDDLYYQWEPGNPLNTAAGTPSSTPTGKGWVLDTSGQTGFPSGMWQFVLETQVPAASIAKSGAAIAAVGIWKVTLSGGAISSWSVVQAPQDDPANQDLRASASLTVPTTTTLSYNGVPAFNLGTNERLYVEFWRRQVSGLKTNNLAQRQLKFWVNDGTARIVHPAADDSAPAHSFSISALSGGSYYSSGTVYFRGAGGGSFRLSDTLADTGGSGTASGASSVTYPAASAPWTHAAETVSTGPSFQSSVYSWPIGAGSPGSQAISGTDQALNSQTTALAFVDDSAAPITSASCNGSPCSAGWYGSSPVSVTLSASDAGSGVAQVKYTTDGTDPVTSGTAVVYSGAFSVATTKTVKFYAKDNVTNSETVESKLIQIDTSAPSAPALSYGSFTNASSSGSTVYYRPGVSGGFTLTASATDPQSGVSSYSFPAAAAGWSLSGSGASRDYSYSGAPSVPGGGQNVTATNGAGLVSGASFYTVSADSTAPASSIQCNGAACSAGWYGGTVSVSLSAGDAASGLGQIKYTTDGSDPATSGTAVLYSGAFSVATTKTVKYVAIDSVGNVESVQSKLIQIDTSAPGAPSLSFGSYTNASASGSTVYYRPGVSGGFTVTGSATDAESGVSSYSFPAATAGWSGAGSGASRDYSYSGTPTPPGGGENVTATNGAGLVSAAGVFSVLPDSSAPSTSIFCNGVSCSGNWENAPVTVTLSANDGGSGVNEIRYTSDGTDPLTSPTAVIYSGSFTVAATTTIKYASVDHVGNGEAVKSKTILVDTSAPGAPTLSYTSFSNASASGSTVYYRPGVSGGFTLTASATDPESGVSSYSFPALGGGWSAGGGGSSRNYNFNVGAADPAEPNSVTTDNNAGLSSAPASFTVTPDSAAPASSIQCNGAACSAGWYGGTVSVSLSAGDAASGLGQIKYTTDGSDPATSGTAVLYSGAFSVATTKTVKYVAIDSVGNVESVQSKLIQIDTSAPGAPSLSFGSYTNASASGSTVYYRPGVSGGFTVTGSATDAESGVSSYSFPALGGGWSESAGSYSFDGSAAAPGGPQDATATNGAGLVSPPASFTVVGDSATPSSSIACNGGACSGWYTSAPVTVTLSAADGGAGVAEIRYTTDGSDPTSGNGVVYSGAFGISSAATVKFRAFDLVGNAESVRAQLVRVDDTAPVTTDNAPAGYSSSAVTVSLNPADSGSGVATTTYSVDGGASQTGTSVSIGAPVDHSNDGSHTVSYRSTDVAGNLEAVRTTTVRIDTTAPAASITAPAAGSLATGMVTLSATAADSASGVASVSFRVRPAGSASFSTIATDTSPPFSASWDSTTAAEGAGDLQIVATDRAGNTSSTGIGITVDNAGPAVALADPGALLAGVLPLSASTSSDAVQVTFQRRSSGQSWMSLGVDTSAPFALDCDTTSLPDGPTELRAVALDLAGNATASSIRAARIDNTAPSGALTAPAAGATVNGDVRLAASGSDADGSGVASVTFQMRASGPGTFADLLADATAPYEATWATSSLPTGAYELRVRTTDAAGNSSLSAPISVRVDAGVTSTDTGEGNGGKGEGGGSARSAPLVLKVKAPKKMTVGRSSVVRLFVSRAATVRFTLAGKGSKKVAAWQKRARAGSTRVLLKIRARVKPGSYRLRITAAGKDGEKATRQIRVRLVGRWVRVRS
jgi:chitobiase/beta-hexosaminidase-like protein/Big-like domain-containing protein